MTTPPRVTHCSLCGATPEPGTFAAHVAEHEAQLAERFPGFRVAREILTTGETHPGLAEMRAESLAHHYFSLLSQVMPQAAGHGTSRDAFYVDTVEQPDGLIRVTVRGRITGKTETQTCGRHALAVFITVMKLWMKATDSTNQWLEQWLEFTEVLATHPRPSGYTADVVADNQIFEAP